MPLTDTTREEIAQVLCAKFSVHGFYPWGDVSETIKDYYREHAKDAIEPIINRLIAEARDKALEEAAGVILSWAEETWPSNTDGEAEDMLRAIRALKTKDNPHG